MILPGFPAMPISGSRFPAITLGAAETGAGKGYLTGVAGTITREPIPGLTLDRFTVTGGTTTSLRFVGDQTIALASVGSVRVDSTTYGIAGWSFSGGFTSPSSPVSPPPISSGGNYTVQFGA